MAYDLHAHTTASDGTFTPKELVVLARENGLTGVGITDHDTCDGLGEAMLTACDIGLSVVPGVELSTSWERREVHVLGYYIDQNNAILTEFFVRMRRERFERMEKMVLNLQNAGLSISLAEVQTEAGEGVIGRPHLARVLVAKGYAESIQDAFSRFLVRGQVGYASRPQVTPEEAVETILAAGGVPVIAHPGLIGSDEIIPALVKVGLQGIEASHSAHDQSQRAHYLELAKTLGLIATGGSDFHGKGAEHRGPLGSVQVSGQVVEQLLSLSRAGTR
ncbi:MAG: hypothetical protein JWN30_65 [Bacilli bacterium]|nr:hypothetical protein [Bacilli bacterium]